MGVWQSAVIIVDEVDKCRLGSLEHPQPFNAGFNPRLSVPVESGLAETSRHGSENESMIVLLSINHGAPPRILLDIHPSTNNMRIRFDEMLAQNLQ